MFEKRFYNTIRDIYVPTAKGSLMRTLMLCKTGNFRVSRRPVELHSVIIEGTGAWGRIEICDGDGRLLWYQPSTFTGSFYVMGGSEYGLIVSVHATTPAVVTINYREEDTNVV
jgi:hypothetical protein